MVNTRPAILAAVFLILIGSSAGFAREEENRLDLNLGFNRMWGHTTYRIGYKNDPSLHFPISKLEWPLGVDLLTFGAKADFMGKLALKAELQKNITSDAGTMKDSDWGTFFLMMGPSFSPYSLDVFSTSDADLEVLILDIGLDFRLYANPPFSLRAGGGYRYQFFKFEAGNLNQFSPSAIDTYGMPFDPFAATEAGAVITYEITSQIPYIEIITVLDFGGKFTFEAGFGYAPLIWVRDEDNHLLRAKLATGDLYGNAFMGAVKSRWNITRHWFVTLGFNYLAINADGTQTQVRYETTSEGPAGTIGTIDEEVSGSQTTATIRIGFTL